MKNVPAALAAIVTALGVIANAQASTVAEPMLRGMNKLLAAESHQFSGMKQADIRSLRKDFSDKLAAARTAAKAEYTRLASGKKPEEIDSYLRSRAGQAAMPAELGSYVEALGGPAKTMQQLDRITDELAANVLDGSKPYAQGFFERALSSMMGVAHARLTRRVCYLAVYVLTVGSGTSSNYDACNRDR